MKKLAFLLMIFFLLFSLTGCKKQKLDIDGELIYTVSKSSSSKTESNISSETLENLKIWRPTNDGKTPNMYYVINNTDTKIVSLKIRPYGYDNFEEHAFSLSSNEKDMISISQADFKKYEAFEFIFITEDNHSIASSYVDLKEYSGFEIQKDSTSFYIKPVK